MRTSRATQLPRPAPCSDVPLVVHSCLVLVPSSWIETRMTPRIKASITAYSTEVAAVLSRRSRAYRLARFAPECCRMPHNGLARHGSIFTHHEHHQLGVAQRTNRARRSDFFSRDRNGPTRTARKRSRRRNAGTSAPGNPTHRRAWKEGVPGERLLSNSKNSSSAGVVKSAINRRKNRSSHPPYGTRSSIPGGSLDCNAPCQRTVRESAETVSDSPAKPI